MIVTTHYGCTSDSAIMDDIQRRNTNAGSNVLYVAIQPLVWMFCSSTGPDLLRATNLSKSWPKRTWTTQLLKIICASPKGCTCTLTEALPIVVKLQFWKKLWSFKQYEFAISPPESAFSKAQPALLASNGKCSDCASCSTIPPSAAVNLIDWDCFATTDCLLKTDVRRTVHDALGKSSSTRSAPLAALEVGCLIPVQQLRSTG